MEDTTKLNTSKLGTKKYWEDFYSLEKTNFESNPEDTGECWFSDNDAEEKMIDFLMQNLGTHSITEKSTIIDLGTGNGHLLFSLYEEGFTKAKLHGVDYSHESIKFSNKILSEKYPEALDNISFSQVDIFDSEWKPPRFDIVLDKGTLDAIALSGLKLASGKTVVDAYPSVIDKLLKDNGVFLITSCNFTQKELIKIAESCENLKLWKTVSYPIFEFGGVKGTTICTVAFIKQKI
ncbi:Efm4p SCDLUD_000334 [Saccharomycodes ludwigii]|uniref:Efm4p n=1 Tax=Saccharomycodes ludwigii TaxID=36035 RepID=UPI001E870DEE|nr:hypothetical protein SCDLUD_000334 [Saccharomycodes ludwigii]KAH3902746.1 hypothetical protein SCDLUD_000334 [Saccharomycodes ludwigii]